MKKAALVSCSNGQAKEELVLIEKLKEVLKNMGLETVESPYLYACENGFVSGTGKDRARVLNEFYADESIDAIFDISGGDMANEVLPYLDYECIAHSEKRFYGFSDLTVVLNAIYAKTGRKSVLFQVKNLVWEKQGIQIERFQNYLNGGRELFEVNWNVLQGVGKVEDLLKKHKVLGGNIRCFLKLAGTPYFPELENSILFLEGLSGGIPQISTYMASLHQMGVFDCVKGVLLGNFKELEKEAGELASYEILCQYITKDMFVAKTSEVGHLNMSKALKIG